MAYASAASPYFLFAGGPLYAQATFGWGRLGASWGHLGSFLGLLGASWRHLGGILGLLGASWGHLGASWGHLGGFLGLLGASWGHLGGILGLLGASWGHLGGFLGHLGGFLGHLGQSKRETESKTTRETNTCVVAILVQAELLKRRMLTINSFMILVSGSKSLIFGVQFMQVSILA